MTDDVSAQLHGESIVIDAHCDALGDVIYRGRRLGHRSSDGQFDLPRALEGGITAELLAVFHEPSRVGSPAEQSLRYIDSFFEEVGSFPHLATAATTAADIVRAKAKGKVALVLSMEGAEALGGSLAALRCYHRLGLRFLGITWNRRNEAADGIGELQAAGGLTRFGRELVSECNRLGIVLDISHLAPPGVRDVLELSEAPVVATHANSHALRPFPRNLTDFQLEAIAATGGVVGATAVPAFLGEEEMRAPLSSLIDHVEHMVRVMGEDHVGLGMDFDGVQDKRVEGIEDASCFPNVTRALVERGHSPARIQKILGGNFLRVFQQVAG
jgi:membrane dipeptidase